MTSRDIFTFISCETEVLNLLFPRVRRHNSEILAVHSVSTVWMGVSGEYINCYDVYK